MKEESVIKKAWKTKRGKALVKLGIWLIIFLVIALILVIYSVFNDNVLKPTPELNYTIEDKYNNFLLNDFKYNIIVESDTDTVLYDGKMENNIDTGTRENSVEVIKYTVENGISKKILLNTSEEYDIYAPYSKDYLDITLVLSKIINLDYVKVNETFTYTINNDTYKVTTNDTTITEIIITSNDIKYTYLFEEME